jgi:hypothetical protein
MVAASARRSASLLEKEREGKKKREKKEKEQERERKRKGERKRSRPNKAGCAKKKTARKGRVRCMQDASSVCDIVLCPRSRSAVIVPQKLQLHFGDLIVSYKQARGLKGPLLQLQRHGTTGSEAQG